MTQEIDDLLAADGRLREILRSRSESDRGAWLTPLSRGAPRRDTRDTRTEDDARKALRALADLAPREGWCLFQSGQLAFRGGWSDPPGEWGAILAAEAVTADGRSLRLGRDGGGRWAITVTGHDPGGEGFWDEVEHAASDPGSGKLRYRRYWRLDGQYGAVAVDVCFLGFSKGSSSHDDE